MVSVLVFYLQFLQTYCIIVEFVMLLRYFISYLQQVHFYCKSHTYIFMFSLFILIQSIIFLIMIFWGYNMCCYDDSETSSYTQRWVNWYRHYLWFQRGYWISIDFLLLVDYFISYFCSVQFNLNTYTHNFMLSLFW